MNKKIQSAEAFGKAIKEYRKQQKITQSQLAAVINSGVRFISDLENGKPTVQLEKALKAANMLGITFEIPSAAALYAADTEGAYD